MENFAENYYPKDLQTEKQEQTVKTQAFSPDIILNMLGKDNPLLSLLGGNRLDEQTLMKTLSSMMQKPQKNQQKKTLDSDFFEEC